MKKLNQFSPLLLILILTIETFSFARNYQVARIQGEITKIQGRRVRVQDKKNQIYWVDKQDIIPRKAQIYDGPNAQTLQYASWCASDHVLGQYS